jgi:hypothetical protein
MSAKAVALLAALAGNGVAAAPASAVSAERLVMFRSALFDLLNRFRL